MTLLIVIVVALLLYVIVAYNGIIKLKNRVKEAWADIDVQLKRRYNLIPNIVESVKGYASHEEGVLTQVTEARANAINATNVKDQGRAENMLAGALKTVFAVAENYPDLKANQNFLQLQGELVDTEDKIQSARRFYNSVTRDFNTKIQQIPAKFVANVMKFKSEEFFEIEEEEQKENVQVSFNKEGTRQADVPAKAAPAAPVVEATPEPADEKKEEAPAAEEPKAQEAPAETEAPPAESDASPAEAEKSAEPAKCPKCGGEMTEGHVCPVKAEEEKPADEPKEDEPAGEEKPAEPTVDEHKADEPKPETPPSDQTAMPLGGEAPAEPVAEEPKAEEAPATPAKGEGEGEEKPAA